MRQTGFIVAIEPYLLRKGLLSLLAKMPGIRVLREVNNVESLAQDFRSGDAEFLLIGKSLYDQCQSIFIEFPEWLGRTLVLAPPAEALAEAADCTLISENATKESLLESINDLVYSEGRERPPELAHELTPREQTIVRLVSLGMTNRQIADELFLSTHTVITHRKNISSKLGIKSVSGLTIYAIVNNLVTIEEASSKAGQ